MYNDLDSFQNGVDSIVDKCTSCGSTTTSSTPNDIITTIQNIYTNRYNTGYNAGKASGTALKTTTLTFNDLYNSSGNFYMTNPGYKSLYISGYTNESNVACLYLYWSDGSYTHVYNSGSGSVAAATYDISSCTQFRLIGPSTGRFRGSITLNP